ncbi:ribonuclease H-like domain-containing protein [Cyathus striatus]|nr:ribonuclease H-like domain-containing protein [Cyathus striatus]
MERDTEVVEASGHAQKKHKDGSGKAVLVNQGIESFVDRALTKKEQDWANTRLLKYLPAEEGRAYKEDMERLKNKENLTYLIDGWEDSMRRSVYGCLLAEVGEYSFIIGLKELTGVRVTADNLLCIIAVCTDNPTTMQAFHCKWTVEYSWILQLPCFMHGINTIMGKFISKNVKIISFFNASHYWGGQLEELAKEHNVTQGLKKNTETRFYTVILQAISLQEHKQILYKLVLELDHWQCNSEFIWICKPLVDVIGDTESRDATLADCMIQLIWAHLRDAFQLALDIAIKWDWSKAEVEEMIKDIQAYANEEKPFDGGDADAKVWWNRIIGFHPLKVFALKIAAVISHAAEVERFFSNLGGVQSVKKSRLTVSHLASLGMLWNNYNCDLYEAAVKEGKVTRCQHGHMHTTSYKGINTERTDILIEGFSIPTPFTTGTENVWVWVRS